MACIAITPVLSSLFLVQRSSLATSGHWVFYPVDFLSKDNVTTLEKTLIWFAAQKKILVLVPAARREYCSDPSFQET
uniref:Uncharacterized protein LOC104223310 isoform X3 n=1 Tax=Nicotiana sylvestris TaxID=4096 RepID=A0A1U7VZ34_NICSY|nr:PREDICTED: uncharacterized protein LOC104223310 isoform X3 [Nicotiana sylvestris]